MYSTKSEPDPLRRAFTTLAKVIALFHHAFVRPTNAARTELASQINPTHVLDRRFLFRRGSRWNRIHRAPAFASSSRPWMFSSMLPGITLSERETRPIVA